MPAIIQHNLCFGSKNHEVPDTPITTNHAGTNISPLNKSTLTPDEDLQYVVEMLRSTVTIHETNNKQNLLNPHFIFIVVIKQTP